MNSSYWKEFRYLNAREWITLITLLLLFGATCYVAGWYSAKL